MPHAVDRAAVQDENQVCILDGGDALGDDELRRLRDLGAQRSADLRVGFRIDGGGRIVEDQDLRLFQQRPRDTQPLLLSAGDVRAALLDVGVVFVRHLLNELIRTAPARRHAAILRPSRSRRPSADFP